jgi:V8-like Glu-specific endopeptidase
MRILAILAAAALATATAMITATTAAATPATLATPATPVTITISPAAQAAALRYWTPDRLAEASQPQPQPQPRSQSQLSGPPRGTPSSASFAGVRTVGALFLSASATENICTASVLNSAALDLVLTAAHCVDDGGGGNYAQNLVYIPDWHNGQHPYGIWPVRSITVTKAWNATADVNDDFAFLTVNPPHGEHEPIQRVTGGLTLGVNRGYAHDDVEVIGYDMAVDGSPVGCRAKSFYAMPDQQEFYCDGFTDGSSGGPWILHFSRRKGTGTVIGDIGGYEQGGTLSWASYSPYFSEDIERLYAPFSGTG